MAEINPMAPLLILLLMAGSLLAILVSLPFVKHRWGWKAAILLSLVTLCVYSAGWRSFRIWGAQQQSLHNATSIGLACRLYASDHGDEYPSKLEDLVPNYVSGLEFLAAPGSQGGTFGYDYFGGRDDDPPGKILLQAHTPFHGKRAVCYSDTSGRLVDVPGK